MRTVPPQNLLRYILAAGTALVTFILLVSIIMARGKQQIETTNGVAGIKKVISSAPERDVPIYSVDTKEKKLAISIDSCWGANYTKRLLEILKEHHVKTTFFLTGIWVKKYPDIVREIAADGHEIGNHSTTHPHLASLSATAIKKQLLDNETMIYELTGKHTRLFRPPYGEYNHRVLKIARSLGYEIVQWSVDSLDWRETGVKPVVDRVLKNARPGAIILFHNSAKYTPQALPIILTRLKERSYKIIPVSELLIKQNYYIDSRTGMQKEKKRPSEMVRCWPANTSRETRDGFIARRSSGRTSK